MSRQKMIKFLEENKDKIVAGYIKENGNEYHYDLLWYQIVDKYSKKRKPGVQIGNIVVISFEGAKHYAELS